MITICHLTLVEQLVTSLVVLSGSIKVVCIKVTAKNRHLRLSLNIIRVNTFDCILSCGFHSTINLNLTLDSRSTIPMESRGYPSAISLESFIRKNSLNLLSIIRLNSNGMTIFLFFMHERVMFGSWDHSTSMRSSQASPPAAIFAFSVPNSRKNHSWTFANSKNPST